MKKKIMGVLLVLSSISLFVAIPFFPMTTARSVDVPFLDEIDSRYMLLFFGFPDCSEVCPTVLGDLDVIYNRFKTNHTDGDLAVVFVNLMLGTDPALADYYPKLFNSDFRGFHPDNRQLQNFQRTFGLKFSEPDEDGQLSHTGYTYLLQKKEGVWHLIKVLLRSPINTDGVLDYLRDKENERKKSFTRLKYDGDRFNRMAHA